MSTFSLKGKLQLLPSFKWWWVAAAISALTGLGIGALGQFDSKTLDAQFKADLWLNANGNQTLDSIAAFAGEIYSPKFAITITIFSALLIWIRTKSILDSAAVSAISAFGWLPAQVYKQIIDESRPDQSLLTRMVVSPEVDNAFPSGHVCFAISFGFAMFLYFKTTRLSKLVLGLWLASVLVMSWARMYSGVHYLSDVLGSVFASIAGLLLICALWNISIPFLQKRFGSR